MIESDLRKSRTVLKVQYMVVTGELTTGLAFYGPFPAHETANKWALDNLKGNVAYEIHDIHKPGE